MLEIKNISKSFGEQVLFSGFSLTLDHGGIAAVIAPSGSGKTTLLRIIAGLETPDTGTVELHGGRVSFAFQEPRLIAHLSALDNVALVSSRDTAAELLYAVGLSDSEMKRERELSGGMKTRVSLARALAFDADIYLLDEPFAGLESSLALQCARLIHERLSNKISVVVSHDMLLSSAAADLMISL